MQELELEQRMKNEGVRRAEAIIQRHVERGATSDTFGGVALLKHMVEPAAVEIAGYLAGVESRPSRRPALFRLAGHMDPFVLAYLTGKVALDKASVRATLLRTTLAIGGAIEDELRLAAFEGEEPMLYLTIARSLRQRGSSPDHARAVWKASADKADIEIPIWSRNEKVQVGMVLFDLFAKATGLVRRFLLPVANNRWQWMVELTEHTLEWLQDYHDKAVLLRPMFMPTLIEPKLWDSTLGGGYHTSVLSPLPLVKRTYRPHVERLQAADLSLVYQGVNAIQSTAWKINTPVLDVMKRAWESGAKLPCMPLRDERELPPKPMNFDDNAEAKREWKHAARDVYIQRVKDRGARFDFSRLLSMASEYAEAPAMYFPHQLDFRGRCYAVPVGLTPQGPDEARALLTFAHEEVVPSATISYGAPLCSALRWLEIHGANTFGYDKVSFDKRWAWARNNRERVLATARDPFADLWWTEADKPWSFLAWCFEIAKVHQTGASSLPISLDGSCNGLQHFSAMLRDPIGGAAVNLIPADEPQDIYQRVADRTVELLREHASTDHPRAWVARAWLDFGIDRKITKRPVMVLPYGGTRKSCLEYVRDAVRERIEAGEPDPFGIEMYRATAYLSGLVWDAIGDVVVAAREAMAWLQQVARIATKANIPLAWTTPSGFVAYQEYRDFKMNIIKTKMRGEMIRLADYGEYKKLDPNRQVLGISPNFVHSLDAAAMMLTIDEALRRGVRQFAMIHDSYGTVAAHTEALSQVIRQSFVSMYEQHDVLAEFARDVSALDPGLVLPLPPPKGVLDLRMVQDSPYFFA